MSMNHEIEVTIEELESNIALGESLLKLKNNADFQDVVEKAYLTEEALRLVSARGNTQLNDAQRDSIMNQIDSIANFQSFLNGIMQSARYAEDMLKEYRAAEAAGEFNDDVDGE